MDQSIQAVKPMGIGELISKTWQLWKEKILVMVKIQLLLVVPVLIIVIILIVGGITSLVFLNNFLENNSSVGIIVYVLLALAGLILLIFITLLAMWPQVAMIRVLTGEKMGTIEAYRQSWSKIFSFWWTSLFAGLLIGLAFLCLIVPGIILSVWYVFIFYILIEENLSGWAAMSQSKKYVSGFWWDVLIKSLVLFGVSIVVSIIYALIASPLEWLLAMIINDATIKEVFSQLIQNAFSLLLTPFSLIYYFLMYKDLKAIKQVDTPVIQNN